MKKLLLWGLMYAAVACRGHRPADHSDHIREQAYTIAPLYGDTVLFAVNSVYTDRIEVKGAIGQLHPVDKKVREVYFQRFVEKHGRWRKIHAIGTTLEVIRMDGGQDSTHSSPFDQYIEFDELGIYHGDTTDPLSLIPLYPGHPVKIHEAWTSTVPVRIAMGEGPAHFHFVIDSLYTDGSGSLLARITVAFSGRLHAGPDLGHAQVTITGGGWYHWNCTIHQRRDTHLHARYRAVDGVNEAVQTIHSDDSLAVYKEQWKF